MPSAHRFKTLFLHIGLSKTGTTSIQHDLVDRADLLESRYDIHFPRDLPEPAPFQGNHSRMLRALFSTDPEAQRRLPTIGIHSPEQLSDYQEACRQQLARGFDRTNASQLLLSAESVCNFKQCDLAALGQWISTLADSVQVIACVRHPVHALSSEIQQRLRVGARLQNLYRNPPFKRLRDLLTMIELQFGRDNLRVYSFHRALENPSGLSTEFFSQIGVDTGEDFISRRNENSSISQEAALLLDALNREVPLFLDGAANPQRQTLAIQPLLAIPGPKYAVPAEVVERARAASREEVDWVQATFALDLAFDSPQPARGPAAEGFSDEARRAIALRLAAQSNSGAG